MVQRPDQRGSIMWWDDKPSVRHGKTALDGIEFNIRIDRNESSCMVYIMATDKIPGHNGQSGATILLENEV